MGTAGRHCRAPGLQGCWHLGMLKFGHLGIWGLVLGCGSAGLQEWTFGCRYAGVLGCGRAWLYRDIELGRHEASGCWAQGNVGLEGRGIQHPRLLSGGAEGLRRGVQGLCGAARLHAGLGKVREMRSCRAGLGAELPCTLDAGLGPGLR